ncbi:hypothetical protein SASPL_114557 [Salvia splendens]|uniref:PHD finger protein ALFIN-LIKE n=1 Tax=Salvia splendens TaxID=180675 RepID=A0A8X8Y3K2_SALSN|nr:hypothetical protein SASPL_114557 [Salvia splendens]
MDGASVNNPRTVDEVFKDFNGRRNALIKALTTEVEDFFQQCDPGELDKENLCLFGLPNEQWEVNLPAEEVPPELPEPAIGINFARDGMPEKDWLALVAVHSDAWLLSVGFYFGARFGFDKADRKRLFNMINDLPTIFEVVTGAAKKQVKDKSSVSNHSGSASKSNPKLVSHYTFKVGVEMNKAHPFHPSFWSSYCRMNQNVTQHMSSLGMSSGVITHRIKLFALPTFSGWLGECQGPKQRMRMRTRMRDWMKRRKTSMGKLCAEHVVRIMPQMNSGFAVTYVRDGSMVSASRSLLLEQSTSSSTSAQPVRTREPGLESPSSNARIIHL